MSEIKKRLLKRFRNRDYRHSYIESFLDSLISTQIRLLREREKWSQKELAEKLGTTQSAVSRIESADHSAWGFKTLRTLAHVFDMALSVKFVSFGDAVKDIEGFRTDRLIRPSFSEDPVFHHEQIGKTESEGENLVVVDFGKQSQSARAQRVSTVRSGVA